MSAIQIFINIIRPFLMIIIRKNIITLNSWYLLYILALWINIFCFYSLNPNDILIFNVTHSTFKYLRFTLHLNKYIKMIYNILYIYLNEYMYS